MRTHRRHCGLIPRADAQTIETIVSAQNLAAARLEPARIGGREAAWLDLTFRAGDRIVVAPFIEVAYEMIEQRECSPLIWPAQLSCGLRPKLAESIEAAVLPWLESLTLNRMLSEPAVRFFQSEIADLFDEAVRCRLPGAASSECVLRAAQPYVDAVRFAHGAAVAVRDPHGGAGAVLLARHARVVRADLGSVEQNAAAAAWFGSPIFGNADGTYAVEFVASPQGHVRCVQTGADSRSLRPPVTIDVPQPHGGSSGRILFALRDDFEQAPDADIDDAITLARRLRNEGFAVELAAISSCEPAGYDLVHGWTLTHAEQTARLFERARARGVPCVLGICEDLSAPQAAWGERIVPALLEQSNDETSLEEFLAFMRSRRLEIDGSANGEAASRAVRSADAVLIASALQETHVRILGFTGEIVVGAAHLEASPAKNDAAREVGTWEFVLAHAPIEPRCNQFLLVRAAQAAGLPLVLAGPITDRKYYQRIREVAGEDVAFVPEPNASTRDAFYRSARVYADVAWSSRGSRRIAQALLGGCAVILRKGSAFAEGGPGLREADPACPLSIAGALRGAWGDNSERVGLFSSPQDVLTAAVRAYAAAQRALAAA